MPQDGSHRNVGAELRLFPQSAKDPPICAAFEAGVADGGHANAATNVTIPSAQSRCRVISSKKFARF